MDLNQDTLYIFTDGSCYPNPGPGGWAAIMIWNGNVKYLYGGSDGETNNTMEFRGILEGLRAREKKVYTVVYSDSQYCINALTSWWKSWERKGWVTGAGAPVKNQEYIREILQHTENVAFKWLKGHAGNMFNEAADVLARKGRSALKSGGCPDPDPDLSKVRGMLAPLLPEAKSGKLPFSGADVEPPLVEKVGKPDRMVPAVQSKDNLRDILAGIYFMSGSPILMDEWTNKERISTGYAMADEFIRLAKDKGEL